MDRIRRRKVSGRSLSDLFNLALRGLMSAVERLSPRLASLIDWLDARTHASWGGPMNGQIRRREIVRRLAFEVRPSVVIETGTYRGDTTAFLTDVTGAPVHSVEANRRYYLYTKRRLARRTDITLHHGDSRSFLRELAAVQPNQAVFIYLDAHWDAELPLVEELNIIAESWNEAVVMIDDFEVPHDAGYAFDDYGPDARLSEEILPASVADWTRLYPAQPSAEETGARRGCVVLVSPALRSSVDWAACGLRP